MKYLKTKHVSTELLTLYSESPEFLNQEKDDGQFTKIGNDKTKAESNRCTWTLSCDRLSAGESSRVLSAWGFFVIF